MNGESNRGRGKRARTRNSQTDPYSKPRTRSQGEVVAGNGSIGAEQEEPIAKKPRRPTELGIDNGHVKVNDNNGEIGVNELGANAPNTNAKQMTRMGEAGSSSFEGRNGHLERDLTGILDTPPDSVDADKMDRAHFDNPSLTPENFQSNPSYFEENKSLYHLYRERLERKGIPDPYHGQKTHFDK